MSFSTTVHVPLAGIQGVRLAGKLHDASLIWNPPPTPPPPTCPSPSLPALPWLASHSCTARLQLTASLVTTGRDISVLSLKQLLPRRLCPPPLLAPLDLPTDLNLTLEDKLGFLFLTLFLWNTPSLHLPLLSLHYLFITLLTSWPPLPFPNLIFFFFW